MKQDKTLALASRQSACAVVMPGLAEAGFRIGFEVYVGRTCQNDMADYTDLRPLKAKYGPKVSEQRTCLMREESSKSLFDSVALDVLRLPLLWIPEAPPFSAETRKGFVSQCVAWRNACMKHCNELFKKAALQATLLATQQFEAGGEGT